MKEKNAPSLKSLEIIYLSFFGVGFIKYAPGTFGSIATLPFLIAISYYGFPPLLIAPLLIFATAGTCYVTDAVQKKYEVHDPSWIVIDESLGMGFAWLFIEGVNPLSVITITILFRFFDIVKIYPANYFDKQVSHGAGTILDDVISGLYAGLLYRFILFPYIFPLFS